MKNEVFFLNKKRKFEKYDNIMLDISFNMNKRKDKDSIGIIKFYDDKIINYVVMRSINNRFEKLIELIINTEENDGGTNGLLICLDEEEKFKKELNNKYYHFLDKKQKDIISKKILVIEKELREKLLMYQVIHSQKKVTISKENQEISEERHHRR